MNQIEFHARITWNDDVIAVDSQLLGQAPQHAELAWAAIESWGVGQPDARHPEGIYLLLKQPPHCEYLPIRAAGSVALEGELRARGYPELTAAAVLAQAGRRGA